MRKYAKVTVREVLESFQSDSEYGLSNTSVASLKKIHGPNKLAEEEKVNQLTELHLLSFHSFSDDKNY